MDEITKSPRSRGGIQKTHFLVTQKNGLFSYDSGGIPRDRRLLHIIFCALGGPILDFWGVCGVASLLFTKKR